MDVTSVAPSVYCKSSWDGSSSSYTEGHALFSIIHAASALETACPFQSCLLSSLTGATAEQNQTYSSLLQCDMTWAKCLS